jgi:cell wall-associated NlpC family hydrolase
LDKADTGDIAFFKNEAGKIVHVGIMLSKRQIIHASGKVRIDKLTEQGIIHSESGKQTHSLHSIRRFV